jgi:hypothetical protein
MPDKRTNDSIIGISDSDDAGNEPAQPPPNLKRKRGPGKKSSKLNTSFRDARCSYFSEEVVDEEASQDPLSYTISIYTVAQMKKDPKKRGDSKNTILCLEPDTIWDTFVAQLLVKIDMMLKPKVIALKDYAVTFSVPRIHPKVTDLADEDMYKFMVERALRSKDRTASITVEPIVDTKVLYLPSLNMCIYLIPLVI